MTCDGLGVCKQKNGRPCEGQVACASGFCADGLCCDQGCRKQCLSCATPGHEGTCSPIAGQDDLDADVTCTGASQTCDAAGTGSCKLKDGVACTKDEECAFGACRTYHRDADGDGYGDKTIAFSRCDAMPNVPAGYVVGGSDCCDSDPDVHPGQNAFFAGSSACGYDYNCNGRSEPDHTTCGSGTLTQPVPACGHTCQAPGLHGTPIVLYTQACR
jgi:hypothetical protein